MVTLGSAGVITTADSLMTAMRVAPKGGRTCGEVATRAPGTQVARTGPSPVSKSIRYDTYRNRALRDPRHSAERAPRHLQMAGLPG